MKLNVALFFAIALCYANARCIKRQRKICLPPTQNVVLDDLTCRSYDAANINLPALLSVIDPSCQCQKPLCECQNVPVCQCQNVPICECQNIPICQCQTLPGCQCQKQICECQNLRVCQCQNVPVCQCQNVQSCQRLSSYPLVPLETPCSCRACPEYYIDAPNQIANVLPTCCGCSSGYQLPVEFPYCGCQLSGMPVCACQKLELPVCGCQKLELPVCGCQKLELPACGCQRKEYSSCACQCLELPVCGCQLTELPVCSCQAPPCCGKYLRQVVLQPPFL